MNQHNSKQQLDHIDWQLIGAIQEGLPDTPQPYLDIATKLGISEASVLGRIRNLQQNGIIKRFGVIVKHHELGYRANAMVVWDVPDEHISGFAQQLIIFPFVSLCYRRPRILPAWPYSLFCMIHGKNRGSVENKVKLLANEYCHGEIQYDILFSKRRFKQKGMFYKAKTAKLETNSKQANLAYG